MSNLGLRSKAVTESQFLFFKFILPLGGMVVIGFILGESLGEREGRAKERKHNEIQNFVVSTNRESIRVLRVGDFCNDCRLKIERFHSK